LKRSAALGVHEVTWIKYAVHAGSGRGRGRRRRRPAVVTDGVPPFRSGNDAARGKLEIVPTGPLLSEATARLHDGRALTDLVVF
jgi:hypothetical protein